MHDRNPLYILFGQCVVETQFLCQTASLSSTRAELGGYVPVLDDTELEADDPR